MALSLPVRLALVGLVGAAGIQAAPAAERPAPPAKAARPAVTLDDLYKRLRETQDEREATGIASLIERRLARSGSDTADLISERAGEALKAKDYPLAIELLDRVTVLEPRWAEGWRRRATAFYLLDDHASAIADLHQALVLEPRHFEAWALLGRVYVANDDKPRALDAFRRALALYPQQEKLKQTADHLAPDIDGRDL